MSKKTLKAAVKAIMDDPDSDLGGAEYDFENETELSYRGESEIERESSSRGELDNERKSHTSRASSPVANSSHLCAVSTPYQRGRVEPSRAPFGELEQFTPQLPRCKPSGSKSKSSLLRRFPSDEGDSNSRKKKRLRSNVEQENMGAVTAVHEYNCEGDRLTTNALLMTLIKRLDRQEKQMLQIQEKMDQAATPSSCSSGRTPIRTSRHKDVPLEVRVSYIWSIELILYTICCCKYVYFYYSQFFY